ncbi:alpha/beta fold hydrolase [Spirillospora sp. NPDC048911]|uniref:alpha/beta fold hydrolase n=1 Tax=Spirillospora sp. NPDC048911 TaxID=3364527 RepID=UPI0037117778
MEGQVAMGETALIERRILVKGVSTLYYEMGSGPVLLLVHGNFANAENWKRTMEDFMSTHRVVALALPGYGGTSPIGDVTPGRLASFIVSFLDALSIDEVIAVGHSSGGLIVAELALAHPERVTRLVMTDSAGLGRAVHPSFVVTAMLPRPVTEAMIAAMLAPGGEVLRASMVSMLFRRPWRVTPREWIEQIRNTESETLLRTSYEAIRGANGLSGQRWLVGDRLKDLAMPTLVIWGANDEVFPVRQARAAVKKIPKARLKVLNVAGHAAYLDYHRQFVDALGPFVRDESVEPAAVGT